MIFRLIKIIFLSLIYVSACISWADDMDYLFSMSLQELVNLDVTTVSKREESLVNAPGVVIVISDQDIKNYGATNLKDVLLRLPNFYMFDSATFKASGMMMRAGATQHLNNHVLYLVNGRPLRESQNGGLYTDMNLLFPIEAIERIEIIRGSGSVLYGSNAYSGGLNIITKETDDDYSLDLKTQNGTDEYSSQSVSLGAKVNSNLSIDFHGNILDYNGDLLVAQDESNITGSEITGKDGNQLFLDVRAYDFRVGGFKNVINVPAVSGRFVWRGQSVFKLKRTFYDIGYQSELFLDWKVSANFSHNEQDRIIMENSGGESMFCSDGHLSEISLSGPIFDDLNVIVGALVDVIKGDLGTRGGKYESERQVIYGQFDYQIFENTQVTAGFQWNKPEEVDADVSPRLAIVHSYSPKLTLKGLYAKAFRSPYGSELFFDSAFLIGDENLKPESIQTIEAQAIYIGDTGMGSITLYKSDAEDLIGRQVISGIPTF